MMLNLINNWSLVPALPTGPTLLNWAGGPQIRKVSDKHVGGAEKWCDALPFLSIFFPKSLCLSATSRLV